ncbi:hypothetical protein CVIRNUC_009054 [Coccomyxa viridis]|uniref:SCP domain-containing protein n=1 Tax=Coccomyxa viridis TaxID=1274662 RepID=A0AAV1IGM9_9CHLO|nr:hypothetical protein CVIRNUC_009054 [Coccomyxa viridis]
MATQNYFSHTGSDGSGLEDRAANNGFYTFPLGENIAAGYISIQSVVLAWMCSEGHRTNLMGCGFDTVGSGSAFTNTSDYELYFTQDFGCSRDDFNCQCPQPVNASANQVPSPAPVCPGAGPIAAPAAAPLAAAPAPAALLEVPATGPAVASQLAAAPVPVPAAGATPTSATPAPAPGIAASPISAAAPVPAASTVSGASPLSAAAPAPAPSAYGASAPLPELGVPTAISYTTADEGAQYLSYYARPGPGGAPAGGPLPELGVPTAISYTTADEGAQYSSYYVQGGPGSAPAGGPVPELGVPTAISYTDVGLGSYSGPLAQSGAPSAGAQAPPAGHSSYSDPAAQGSASSSAYAQGPTASFLGTKVAPGLYATAMELPGYTGALATTNSQTAVLVLTLLAPAAVNTTDVSLALQGGAQGTVADVQAFPDQASSYLIEVQHPSGFVGDVVVSLPSHAEILPLTYQVMARNLVVQSLGFNLCSASSSTS